MAFTLNKACPSASTLSDPDIPDAGAETEDDEEPAKFVDSSSHSEGQQSPLKSSKAEGQAGVATDSRRRILLLILMTNKQLHQ